MLFFSVFSSVWSDFQEVIFSFHDTVGQSLIKMLLVLIAILNFLIFLNIKKVLIQSVSIISLIW